MPVAYRQDTDSLSQWHQVFGASDLLAMLQNILAESAQPRPAGHTCLVHVHEMPVAPQKCRAVCCTYFWKNQRNQVSTL